MEADPGEPGLLKSRDKLLFVHEIMWQRLSRFGGGNQVQFIRRTCQILFFQLYRFKGKWIDVGVLLRDCFRLKLPEERGSVWNRSRSCGVETTTVKNREVEGMGVCMEMLSGTLTKDGNYKNDRHQNKRNSEIIEDAGEVFRKRIIMMCDGRDFGWKFFRLQFFHRAHHSQFSLEKPHEASAASLETHGRYPSWPYESGKETLRWHGLWQASSSQWSR